MTLSNPAQYISGRTVQEQMNSLIDYVDTRAAEVATDAIASDVAQVHQDMLDADADAAAAAASAAAAAGTLANAVKKTGEASQSIAGDIAVSGDLSGGTVTVPAPVNNTDAASKKYVDDSLDNYSPMVRDTGNKTIAGVKTFTSEIAGVAVGMRIRGQFTSGKWYEVAKFAQSGRRCYSVKITYASATFDSVLQIEGITGTNSFMCRRLGNINTSSYPTNSIAIATDASNNKCILVKGYDNRWFCTVEIGEEYRTGSVMEGTQGGLVAMDDLSSYGNIVYGSDMS